MVHNQQKKLEILRGTLECRCEDHQTSVRSMAKVYSLRDMKREMRGDEQKAYMMGKIALKLFDLVKTIHSNLES